MIRRILSGSVAFALISACGISALAGDKEDVLAAAKKLADTQNYTFTSSMEGGFGGGEAADTKIEKEYVSFSVASMMGGGSSDVIMKGPKAVVKGEDGKWKLSTELQTTGGDMGFSPDMFVTMRLSSFATPTDQVKTIIEKAANLKKDGEVYSADLAEATAKEMLSPKMPAGMDMFDMGIKNPKGSIKVWVKEGSVNKTEIHLSGSMNMMDQEMPIDQTTTVTIKAVGATKVEVPAEAKAKLDAAPTTAPAK